MTEASGQEGIQGRLDLESRLVLERYRQISRMMPVLYLAHAINGVSIAVTSRGGDFPILFSIILPSLLVTTCLWKFWVWLRRDQQEVDVACARRRIRQTVAYFAAMCLVGGLWALGAYVEVSYEDLLLPPFFAAVFGLSTAMCLAALPRVPQVMLGLTLAPVTMAMLLRSEDILRPLAISIIMLAVVLVRLASNHARGVETTLRLQDQLEQQAWFDSLTGLANRRALVTTFEQARQGAAHDDCIAVLIIDLDGFKEANDTYGHIAGDGVLVETAERLQALFSEARLIARLGGDEFLVLFAGNQQNDWEERIAAAATVLAMPVADGLHTIPISASFGHARAQAETAHLDQLLIAADEELYANKARRSSHVRRRA